MTADNEHGEKTATVSMMVALEDRDDLVRAMREVDIVQGHWKKVTSSIKGFVHTFHSKCESALLIDTSINKIVENRKALTNSTVASTKSANICISMA